MADEKTVRKPRGTPIDRGIALLRTMDDDELACFNGVIRGFIAARGLNGSVSRQAMLELGERAAEDE